MASDPDSEPAKPLPGKGLFGWLGRQVGYVAKAVKHDPELIARKEEVVEKSLPDHPDVVFRRTITDEVRRAPRQVE